MNFDRDVAFPNKIRIIDLLNKIANGEEVPKKVKYDGIEYEEEPCYMLYKVTGECNESQLKDFLNDRVEIIEEDKEIEKLKSLNNVGNSSCLEEFKDKQQLNNHLLKDKINELIDKVNSLEDK